jgi:hypothetical protein
MPDWAVICKGPTEPVEPSEPFPRRLGINAAIKLPITFRYWLCRDAHAPEEFHDDLYNKFPKPQWIEVEDAEGTWNYLKGKYAFLKAGNYDQRTIFLALLWVIEAGAKTVTIYGAPMKGDVHDREEGTWDLERKYLSTFIRAFKRIGVRIKRKK